MTRSSFASFAAYGPNGASTRVRLLDWAQYLGFDPALQDYLGTNATSPRLLVANVIRVARLEAHLRRLQPTWDTAFVQRCASPLSAGAIEERLLRLSSYGVYDLDDAVFLPSGSKLYDGFRRHHVPARAAMQADVVIAGNAYLADWASEHAKRVVVIPSCVATDIVVAKTDYALHDAPRICWIGSHSTESYLVDIASSLVDVHRQTGARIRLIGSPTGNLPAALEAMVDRIPWTADTWAGEAAACDVGIMPVPDDAWARGKCGYKLIQYGALGLPVVGTPVGVNPEILSRLGGHAPESANEWAPALADYIGQSEAQRAAVGQQARSAVEKYYSFRAHAATFVEAVFPTGVPAAPATASSSVPRG